MPTDCHQPGVIPVPICHSPVGIEGRPQSGVLKPTLVPSVLKPTLVPSLPHVLVANPAARGEARPSALMTRALWSRVRSMVVSWGDQVTPRHSPSTRAPFALHGLSALPNPAIQARPGRVAS